MNPIVDYHFDTIPAAPAFLVERPAGTRPFTFKDGGVRFRYKGTTALPRVEISPWGPKPDVQAGVRLPKGVPFLYKIGFRIPREAPFIKGKYVIFQWHQKNGRNPPLSLEVVGSELRLVRLWGDATNGNPNRATIWSRPFLRDLYYEVEACIKFAYDSSGYIEWKFQDDLERSFLGGNCYTDPAGLNPKLGIYYPNARTGATDTLLVDFFEWRIM